MTRPAHDFAERLVLLKNPSRDISVPCKDLEQHQLDGIRFLFRQYKKVKPGVILNFPSGCGTAVQVAIFISAILEDLEKPVLILYDKETEKEDWLQRFDKWTTVDKDLIAVNPKNNFVKKPIQIINIADIVTLPGRQWSVVIIKSDYINQICIKCGLKVDFKIWITSTDMKKDLVMLRTIYTWMYPKSAELFNKIVSPSDTKETLKNSLVLDSLLEDVLLTRRDLKPFQQLKLPNDMVNYMEYHLLGSVSKVCMKPGCIPTKFECQSNLTRKSNTHDLAEHLQNDYPKKVADKTNHEDLQEVKSTAVDQKIQRHLEQEIPAATKISKKNKDATGTKIKRSKKSKQNPSPFTVLTDANTDDVHAIVPQNNSEISPTIPTHAENIAVGEIQNINKLNVLVKSKEVDKPKLDVETFIRDNPPLVPDSRLCEAVKILDDMVDRMRQEKERESTMATQNSQRLSDDLANGDSSRESLHLKYDDTEEEDGDPTIENKFDSQPVIQNVFTLNTRSEEFPNIKAESDNEPDERIVNTEINCSNSDVEVIEDQESEVGLTTGVKKQTDGSFDWKIKNMEELALKKFKGSFLDNIF